MTDTHAATELEQYIENDADLHRQQHAPILKNLATKKARGQYKHPLAVKLFGYLVESGAKKYAKAFGSPNQPWHKMFDVPTRKRVAEELTKSFEAEHKLGNYDFLLPKKYQPTYVRGSRAISAQTFTSAAKSGSSHARKKVSWKTPESLKIVWSPVNIAWLALWPGKGRIQDQQVLKIADTDGMHSWLRETYGDPYGRVGASRAHSTMSSAHARKAKSMADYEAEGYRAQTWYLADSPYSQPKIRDAWQRGAWKWQQEQRGLRPAKAASHAHKKSPAQLNREIDAALGKRRSA